MTLDQVLPLSVVPSNIDEPSLPTTFPICCGTASVSAAQHSLAVGWDRSKIPGCRAPAGNGSGVQDSAPLLVEAISQTS